MLSPSIGSVVDRGWMGLRAHGFLSARPIHSWLLEAGEEMFVENSHPHIRTLDHHKEILERAGGM